MNNAPGKKEEERKKKERERKRKVVIALQVAYKIHSNHMQHANQQVIYG